jgi:hypothetical protein
MASRTLRHVVALATSAIVLVACRRSEQAMAVLEGWEAAAPAPSIAPSAGVPAAATPVPAVASTATAVSPALVSARPGPDASTGWCRVVRGPIELPIRAPARFVVRGERVDAVLDDDGRPRVVPFTAGPFSTSPPVSPPPVREPADGVVPKGLRLHCATAGEYAFCPDRSGAVHRAGLVGDSDRIVASGRIGTSIAAGTLGGGHTALMYLASRKTSEGWVSEAWLEVDDEPPMRVSEDGSGATSVDLAVRGASLLALSIDARAALTAMHVRSVVYEGGVRLGEDAVVFVGGPGDRQTGGTLAVPASGPGWALLPIARDISDFGLATVRLDDPPHVDEPTVWSMYPNGLDPAPIAVAPRPGGPWVARVCPQSSEPGSAQVLELGEVDAAGDFVARDTVPTADSPSELSLALGPHGDLWLAWMDASGSWVERLACR